MNKILLFFCPLLLIPLGAAYGQTSGLAVYTNEETEFRLWVDEIEKSKEVSSFYTIKGLQPGKYKCRVLLLDSSEKELEKMVHLKEYVESSYVLKKEGENWEMNLISEVEISKQSTDSVKLQTSNPGDTNSIGKVDSISSDSLSRDSILTTPYQGRKGCSHPISSTEFKSIRSRVAKPIFEDDKVSLARDLIKGTCLRTEQLVEILQLLEFEDNRLALAKYAYQQTFDLANFDKVKNAFAFESSKEELEEFLRSKAD